VANVGAHIGNLWSSNGTLLATATFTSETASGWQQVNFLSPVPISAGLTYVASYFTPAGHYSFDPQYFGSGIITGPLTALADGTDGPNGVYAYGGTSSFPSSTYNGSNYWVDVVFSTTVTPTVVSFTPSGLNVAVTSSVSTSFNEPIDATTVNSGTFQLLDSNNASVSASVGYNAATNTVTLQPVATLQNNTTYTVVLLGGPGGLRDSSGTSLPSNFSWTFTTAKPTAVCPCSIWTLAASPGTSDGGDPTAGEYGLKFSSDVSGYVTGIRFYKGSGDTGTHVGHLWTSAGALLASVTFTNETVTGWQQAMFIPPVSITANTTYVVSYFAPAGHYPFDPAYFANSFDSPPLHALANGVSTNGVYAYGSASLFPTLSYNASNYWVDVVFMNGILQPRVVSTTPSNGQSGVSTGTSVSASLNEPLDPNSVSSGSLIVFDANNNALAGTVSYNSSTATITFRPALGLYPQSNYTAVLSSTVGDTLGNTLGSAYSWSFTTGAPPANSGPGGPILLISSVVNPFSRYYDEILRAEGLNEFTAQDISTVTSAVLSSYKVAILGDIPLSSAQVSTLTNWVNGGGKLIAMHPDKQLAGLLGLTSTSQIQSSGYLLVNTASGPGAGIVGTTIQYHGPADLYSLNGASSIATLYSSATQSTTFPAVTLRSVGGGQVAAFTYDLARSVVYTRQGNPAWSGQHRDPYVDPIVNVTPIRSVDLFYGNTSFDPEPDWVDLSKVAIPQADEQQRLLVNLVEQMASPTMPLPRFWYLPNGVKATVVMTGDDHDHGGTAGRFDQYISMSAPNCSLADWQCIRATSYIEPATPITAEQAASYVSQGFEISMHPDSTPTCSDWTPDSLASEYDVTLAGFKAAWPNIPSPATVRIHCIRWSDYDTQPQVELNNGIRLDTNYYYWPSIWVQDRPGFFTGSGMPMRFADRNGNTIDVYQAATQLPDETTWTYPDDINLLLSNATGPLGYYGVLTTNMHTDEAYSAGSDAIIAAAENFGVPIVSAQQMLTWLDGRNSSYFGQLAWDGKNLSFTISVASGARNLQAMLPVGSSAGNLAGISLNGAAITFSMQVIKGLQYAIFPATPGSYKATYGPGTYFTISGTVSGTTVGGITISLSGPLNAATQTDSSGRYNFAGLPNGSYSVSAYKAGEVLSPPSQSVTVSGANVTNINFTSSPISIASITITPTEVLGGTNATATVTLSGPAPPGGASIQIGSSDDTVASVLAERVEIAANSTSATFSVVTHPVSDVSEAYISVVYYDDVQWTGITVDPPHVQSLSLSPTSVTGGATSIGTITLNAPAGPAGARVTLSSSNSNAASVSSSVTVAAGATSASFTVTTHGVSSDTVVTISATYNATASSTIAIHPPVLTGLSLNPISITGGSRSTGTVTLNGPAPIGGASVTLQDNNTATTVPSSVTVASGQTAATFNVNSSAVGTATTVTVTATYRGVSMPATLTVNPPQVQSVSLSPNPVAGGRSNSTATVTLTGPAPSGGARVTLSSSDPSAGSVPASVTVAANATTATFTVTTLSVSSQTSTTISATYNATASAVLTVNPFLVSAVTLNPTTVTGGSTNSTGTVILNGPAPAGGTVVTLSSSNTAAATVPASVTVTANATTATFTVTSKVVSAQATATVSATFNATVTATLTVNPLLVSSVTFNPLTVTGGNNSTGTVTLSGPAPPGGALVTLQDNSAVVGIPASVTVSAGQTSATFTATSTPVSAATVVSVTATYGSSSASGNVTVNPPQIQAVSLSPSSVLGGNTSTGTVTLNGKAPTGGMSVALGASNNTVAQVPSSVTVAAGATTATFTVTTTTVSANTNVTISGTLGATASATLTVQTLSLSSVTLNPTSVRGGTTSTGTLTLNGPAPSGGARVTLGSSNTGVATVPSSVTIPAGSSTITFTVTTSGVTFTRTVTITGTYVVARTATLTVTRF
jgi:hypothetical protein